MSIRISQKHGVNPTMMKCFFCGEEKGIALLGRLKGDAEAPRSAFLDDKPCDKCKEYMEQGVIVIETKDDDVDYRLGGFVVVKDRVIEDIVNDEKLKESILKKRVAFMATSAFRQIFKGEI